MTMEVHDILKYSSFSTRTEFVWANMKLRVPCFPIQFIFSLPYSLFSLKSGTFLGVVIYGVTCFKDERLDVVNPNYVDLPVIKMSVIAIIE